MILDEPYDETPAAPPAPPKAPEMDGDQAVRKIKTALEARKKFILLSSLEKAESIRVEGETLRIVFAPADSSYKSQVESSRKAITEACFEVVGRPLSVSVNIGEQGGGETSPKKKEGRVKEETSAHPKVKAVVDKFHGEVLEVVKPES
jgi:hypothetical protein